MTLEHSLFASRIAPLIAKKRSGRPNPTNKPMADRHPSPSDPTPQLPDRSQLMEVRCVTAPHPALLEAATLLDQCDFRAQRRSGPGGQHRNKTSSGVFLCHQPTGITCEATERRSQAENRSIALGRLRYRLAIGLRTPSPIAILDERLDPDEAAVRERFRGKSLRIADSNEAKPAVLALLLNDLHAAGGQPSLVASFWSVSTSSIVALTKSHPPALALLNQIRNHHGRRGLK